LQQRRAGDAEAGDEEPASRKALAPQRFKRVLNHAELPLI
jgi:hypothetical protein